MTEKALCLKNEGLLRVVMEWMKEGNEEFWIRLSIKKF